MYKEISEYTAVIHRKEIEWQNNYVQIDRKITQELIE